MVIKHFQADALQSADAKDIIVSVEMSVKARHFNFTENIFQLLHVHLLSGKKFYTTIAVVTRSGVVSAVG